MGNKVSKYWEVAILEKEEQISSPRGIFFTSETSVNEIEMLLRSATEGMLRHFLYKFAKGDVDGVVRMDYLKKKYPDRGWTEFEEEIKRRSFNPDI